jgi:hypothetical protein
VSTTVWDEDNPEGRAAALAALDEIEAVLWVLDPETGVKYRMDPPCSIAPELWWPTVGQGRTDETGYAKAMCGECPAGENGPRGNVCRAYADIAREAHGIWGGASAAQIRKDRTRRRRQAA